ncbi:MAG TPA: COX15/CtaA family protein [Acidimicrobiales bacterium]|nr:COX15/CtaA family protein [Acidimicrobiales bacterium]
MQLPRPTPRTFRKIALFALLALGFIVITGGAVRLTKSGLGCPDWPTCTEKRFVATWDYHQMVEFVNRMITGLVSLAVILAVLGSLRRIPKRRDLIVLSLGLVAGVFAQAILGGQTVKNDLDPRFVMAHFLLSMVLITNAVVLYQRACEPDAARTRRPVVSGDLVATRWLVVGALTVAIFLGTLVTGTGPHGGDAKAERLRLFLPDVARAHGVSVAIFLLFVLITLWRLSKVGAPNQLMRRGEVVVAVAVVQGAIGYIQYFTGVPVVLVGFHIAGATALWAATVWFFLGFTTMVASHQSEPEAVTQPAEAGVAFRA